MKKHAWEISTILFIVLSTLLSGVLAYFDMPQWKRDMIWQNKELPKISVYTSKRIQGGWTVKEDINESRHRLDSVNSGSRGHIR